MSHSTTILIVEDSAVQRVMLQRLLQKSGYLLLTAKDGREGLTMARAHQPALVISDINMPHIDGYEMCKAMKRDPHLQKIPVLLVTNMDDPAEVIRSLESGADNHLTKPVDDAHLLEKIRLLLETPDDEYGAGNRDGLKVSFAGSTYQITAGRRQTMNLLLSTYEDAVRKKRALTQTQRIIREKDALLIKTVQTASRAKSDFIANLSHEIRTPMNAIMGLTGLALRTKPEPNMQGYLEKIDRASQTLMGCLNDILDFSKIEAGKLELYPVLFDPHDLINGLADMFGDQAADKGLELIFSIPLDYPDSLFGDAKRLQQIWINLLRNAIKFTSQGSIIVKAHPCKVKSGPVELLFSVEDTGIGIDPKRMEKLFHPFAQADPSIAIEYGGSGLGLNICKQLVGMMGGQIQAESVLGEGSTFRFSVLLDRPEETHTDFIVPKYLQDIRILVVDDHDITREIMQEMLLGFELSIRIADCGETALSDILIAEAEGKPFHLVFMDWRMPGMDGIETTQAIRKQLIKVNPKINPPKMIMLTAFGKNTVQNQARHSGIDLFLHKPVTRVQLFNAILEVFGEDPPTTNRSDQAEAEESIITSKVGGARILLAEDNPINQQVAQELLRRVGIIVETANHGKEVLDMLEKSTFDMILMDVQMPEMDGHEATQHIRRDPRFAQLPIVAMTAHVLESVREKSLKVGMNDHITKPIHVQQLYATLVQWLNPDGTHARFGQTRPPPTPPATPEPILPATLDGIDMTDAMERFRGQQPFFKKMLLGFKHYDTLADDIRQALKQDDLTSAKDMAHTMKGMAGNLAATDLYEATRALEHAMAQHHAQNTSERLKTFEQALHRILKTVRALEPIEISMPSAQPADATVVAMNKVETLLQALSGHLKARDTDAELTLEALQKTITTPQHQPHLKQMETQVSQFDYPSALTTLEALEHALKTPEDKTKTKNAPGETTDETTEETAEGKRA